MDVSWIGLMMLRRIETWTDLMAMERLVIGR